MQSTELQATQAQELYLSEEEFPVDLHEAAIWLGVRVDSLKRTLFDFDGFTEGVDYTIIFPQIVENSGRGRPTKSTKVTVECFKHLSMMVNTEQGFQVRDYFLQCEKSAKRALKQLDYAKEAAWEDRMTIGRQRKTITSLMCTNGSAMTAGQLYLAKFPNDPELSIGEKRVLSKLLGTDAAIPNNAKHFTLGEVDFGLIQDFRDIRMQPIVNALAEGV